MFVMSRHKYMDIALQQARKSKIEVPVGAVLVNTEYSNMIISSGNLTYKMNDPTAHAEMIVMRMAKRLISQRYLKNYNLYVTLEPCSMCAAAISLSRLKRVYFGAYNPKCGGIEHGIRIFDNNSYHYRPEIYGGIKETECLRLLTNFFKDK